MFNYDAYDTPPCSMPLQILPRLQHQPSRAVFAELTQLLLLQHAEGFAGEGAGGDASGIPRRVERVAHLFPRIEDVGQFALGQVGGVEDVAQLFARQTVKLGVVRIEFGAQRSAAVFVPAERREGDAERLPLTPRSLKGGGFAGRLSTVSVPPNARADPSVS